MKRGKDDEKITGPMFPRLHVNDTAKGGPKPPPRNKMALYEQFSIPSQRFNPGAFPSQPSSYGNLVHPPCSSQGSDHDRNMTFPAHLHPSAPTHVSDKFQSRQANEADSSPALAQTGKRKRPRDEDDFTVPVFVHPGNRSQTQNGTERATSTSNYCGHPMEIHNSSENCSKGVSISAPNSRQEVRNGSKESSKEGTSSRQHSKKSATNLAVRDHVYKSSEGANASSNQQDQDNSCDNLSGLNTTEASMQQDHSPGQQVVDTTHDDHNIGEHARGVDNVTSPLPRSNSQSGEVDNDRENHAEQMCRSLQTANAESSDDGSDTSMVDSLSGSDVTPDDVVEILGQKHFWKARRAIVNQQRVFAIQVFELHRLVKVQKLIAGSPQMMLEDATFLGKSSIKIPPEKKLPSGVTKTTADVVKRKDESEKANHKLERSAENAVGRTAQSSLKNGTQPSNHGSFPGNPPHTPVASDSSMVPWGFHHATGHQWLVPVMSPSEGLVYKPYPGPGFPGTGCGGCGPVGSNFFPGGFMNPGYGVPTPHHYQGMGVVPGAPPVGPSYFPPYGMPVISPAMSGAPVEQMNWFNSAGSQVQNGQISGRGASTNGQQNTCSLPTQQSGADPAGVNLQISRDCEPQGSIASSPNEREPGHAADPPADGIDALPLFPMGPADADGIIPHLQDTEAIKVIRVVPHNPSTASKSAARIFQSIQEERKQYDLL